MGFGGEKRRAAPRRAVAGLPARRVVASSKSSTCASISARRRYKEIPRDRENRADPFATSPGQFPTDELPSSSFGEGVGVPRDIRTNGFIYHVPSRASPSPSPSCSLRLPPSPASSAPSSGITSLLRLRRDEIYGTGCLDTRGREKHRARFVIAARSPA